MSKAERKREMIKRIAQEPYIYDTKSLADALGVDETTLSRDLKQLAESGYSFAKNDLGQLFLVHGGYPQDKPVKDPVIRQLEIMDHIASAKNGKSRREITSHFYANRDTEVSERTIERALKELKHKELILQAGERYLINPEKVIAPVYLDAKEKTLLLDALAVAEGTTPLPEEAKSVAAQIKIVVGTDEPAKRQTVYVHGRSPVYDLTVNYFCRRLESAARSKQTLRVLYRKPDEPASERVINPLGLVYYWVLDKWYVLAAGTQNEPVKTYAVENILDCEETGESFARPESFSLKDHFQSAWGIFKGDQPTQVKVHFRNYFSVTQRVREETAHRAGCQFIEDETGLIMTDTVQGLEEFAVWLRSFGPGAEVLEPAELREKVVAELRNTLACYEEDRS